MEITAKFGLGISGRVHAQVLDAKTKKVIKDYGWQNNMITNYGMNGLFNGTITALQAGFMYAVVGTGTTPVKDPDPSPATASQSGNVVTVSGGTPTLTAGRTFRWASGATATILSLNDATHAVVHNSQTVADGAFSIYRTDQSGLISESKRSNTYVTGSGFCETVFSTVNTFRMRRTYDFTAEVGTVVYGEVGLSWTSNVGSNLFSRVVFDTPITILAGQQIRIQYDLTTTFTPSTPTNITADIPGWPVAPATDTNGQIMVESICFQQVNSSGGYDSPGSYFAPALEPTGTTGIYMNADTRALATVPANTYGMQADQFQATTAGGYASLEAYVNNSFTNVKYFVIPTNQGNMTTCRSIAMCGNDYDFHPHYAVRILLGQNQTKDNLHKLTIRWQTWVNRVLPS